MAKKLKKAELARADAYEASAQIAEHLNGWGSHKCPYCREIADHIAKCIRLAAAVPMAKVAETSFQKDGLPNFVQRHCRHMV